MDVSLTGVTVDFPGRPRVLDGVDLRVAHGEQVALLGPSGAGKSTLLRVLLGVVRPVAGGVRVGGRDPFASRAEATRIRRAAGIVRQRDDLVRGLSVRTNILVGEAYRWRIPDWLAVLGGAVPRRYADRLTDLTARHGIDDLLDSRVEHLSGGQRQRVALARALLPGPSLLLADECTTGLDPHRAAEVLRHLRDCGGATLLVTTHDLTVARRFPRVVALRDSRVVFDGADLDDRAVRDIYGDPHAGDVRRTGA